MANTSVFQDPRSKKNQIITNEAGGKAYKMSDEAALAQLAVTGTFNNTFYASAKDQLKEMTDLCGKCRPEYIARLAVYARKHGYMKDTPAFLLAHLVTRDTGLARGIFSTVIDNGRMLRNFVQIMRSGAVGRKSLGSSAKKMVKDWLDSRTEDQIFRDSVGNKPSLMDCVRLSHHAPKSKSRDALYGYLLGWEHDKRCLPNIVKEYEKFKKGMLEVSEVPDIPFQMLTSLELGQAEWTMIAANARWQMTRMNLNTFARHMVFEDSNMVDLIAKRLRNEDYIRAARAFPYQLLATYMNIGEDIPRKIVNALHDAMEISVSNIPEINGHVYVCPDISGSMHSSVTGERKGATSKVMCVDVAALVASAFLRKNEDCKIIPFHNAVVTNRRFDARDTVMTTAKRIRNLPAGGTTISAPLRHIASKGWPVDLVVIVSDNESWCDRGYTHQKTATLAAWRNIKKNNKRAKLVCIDIQPYTSTQAYDRNDVLNVGGFSDTVFQIISMFHQFGLDAGNWTRIIEAQEV